MILKAAGALLILGAAAGLGWWTAGQFKGRLCQLEQLRQLIYFLKGEITYSQAPLPEALERAGERGSGPLGRLFSRTAQEILERRGDSLDEIWASQVEQTAGEGLPLTGEDIRRLKDLGKQLGYLDVDMQERTLLLYLEQLDLEIGYLREHKREKCRLYTSLGVMGGLFLVIIMY